MGPLAFSRLPNLLQQFHRDRSRSSLPHTHQCSGHVIVTGGISRQSKWLAQLLQLPSPITNGEVTTTIKAHHGIEHWNRVFTANGITRSTFCKHLHTYMLTHYYYHSHRFALISCVASTQWAEGERLIERFGPFEFAFDLV
jgi:hypothetical protein